MIHYLLLLRPISLECSPSPTPRRRNYYHQNQQQSCCSCGGSSCRKLSTSSHPTSTISSYKENNNQRFYTTNTKNITYSSRHHQFVPITSASASWSSSSSSRVQHQDCGLCNCNQYGRRESQPQALVNWSGPEIGGNSSGNINNNNNNYVHHHHSTASSSSGPKSRKNYACQELRQSRQIETFPSQLLSSSFYNKKEKVKSISKWRKWSTSSKDKNQNLGNGIDIEKSLEEKEKNTNPSPNKSRIFKFWSRISTTSTTSSPLDTESYNGNGKDGKKVEKICHKHTLRKNQKIGERQPSPLQGLGKGSTDSSTSTRHSKQNHHERFKKFLRFCASGFRRIK